MHLLRIKPIESRYDAIVKISLKLNIKVFHVNCVEPRSDDFASPLFCILFMFLRFGLTEDEFFSLLNAGSTNVYRKVVALLLIRFGFPVAGVWKRLRQFLVDDTEVTTKVDMNNTLRNSKDAERKDVKPEDSKEPVVETERERRDRERNPSSLSLGEFAEELLNSDKYFSTNFPRVPIPLRKSFQEKLALNVDVWRTRALQHAKNLKNLTPGARVEFYAWELADCSNNSSIMTKDSSAKTQNSSSNNNNVDNSNNTSVGDKRVRADEAFWRPGEIIEIARRKGVLTEVTVRPILVVERENGTDKTAEEDDLRQQQVPTRTVSVMDLVFAQDDPVSADAIKAEDEGEKEEPALREIEGDSIKNSSDLAGQSEQGESAAGAAPSDRDAGQGAATAMNVESEVALDGTVETKTRKRSRSKSKGASSKSENGEKRSRSRSPKAGRARSRSRSRSAKSDKSQRAGKHYNNDDSDNSDYENDRKRRRGSRNNHQLAKMWMREKDSSIMEPESAAFIDYTRVKFKKFKSLEEQQEVVKDYIHETEYGHRAMPRTRAENNYHLTTRRRVGGGGGYGGSKRYNNDRSRDDGGLDSLAGGLGGFEMSAREREEMARRQEKAAIMEKYNRGSGGQGGVGSGSGVEGPDRLKLG